MARTYKRKEGQAVFAAGTQGRIELSRNFQVTQLLCRLDVNHDNATGATFYSEDFANLINSLQVVANGNKTIKHIDVKKAIYNAVFFGGKRMLKSVDSTIATGRTSTIYFTIDFAKPGMVRPLDTVENTGLYTTFDLLIDWASSSNVGTNITVNSATLSVSSSQLVGYSRNPGERIAHNIETQRSKEVTSSTSEFQIDLPVKKLYQRFLIGAFVDGVRNGDMITAVKIKSGTTTFMELDAEDLRVLNAASHKVQDPADTTGLYLIDFVERGRNSDALNTNSNFNTLELVLSVTKQSGTNKIVVYSDSMDIDDAVEVQG